MYIYIYYIINLQYSDNLPTVLAETKTQRKDGRTPYLVLCELKICCVWLLNY